MTEEEETVTGWAHIRGGRTIHYIKGLLPICGIGGGHARTFEDFTKEEDLPAPIPGHEAPSQV